MHEILRKAVLGSSLLRIIGRISPTPPSCVQVQDPQKSIQYTLLLVCSFIKDAP